jgi:hypothetical protein
MVTIEDFSASGKSKGKVTVTRVVKTDAEWRAQLSPDGLSGYTAGGYGAAVIR